MPWFSRVQLRKHGPAVGLSNLEAFFRNTGIAPLGTSGAWSSANLAIYTPILVPSPCMADYIYLWHGATAADNYDVGIYAPDAEGKPGTRLVSLGSTAQVGINTFSANNIADVWLPEGLAYLACAFNGTTGTVKRVCQTGTALHNTAFTGMFHQVGAFPLPASATPVAVGSPQANVPYMAAAVRTFG